MFGCGMLRGIPTDRCHIEARVWGGQDELANLHLLCVLCHEMSEGVDGLRYWRWLKAQHMIRAECWGAARMLSLSNLDAEINEFKIRDVYDLSIAHINKIRRIHSRSKSPRIHRSTWDEPPVISSKKSHYSFLSDARTRPQVRTYNNVTSNELGNQLATGRKLTAASVERMA